MGGNFVLDKLLFILPNQSFHVSEPQEADVLIGEVLE